MKNPADAYWIVIAIAPLSIFTTGTHIVPIFMWASFALAFVAALNRFWYSGNKMTRIFAGVIAVLYRACIALML